MNIENWKEFKVGYIENKNQRLGTGLFQIVNSVPYHNKDIIEQEDGLNYITRSKFNNGLKCKVEKCDKFVINPAGTISFGAENANFFYQREEYITGNKMYYLDTQDLSEYSAMFLQSVLEETFSNNFSFSDGLIPTRIYDETILLPATPSGTPDWTYMESYMREMEKKAKERLDRLEEMRKQEKKRIDVNGWGEFKVGELFDVEYGSFIAQKDSIDESEGVPHVTTSGVNNGISYYVEKPMFDGNCITVASDGAMGASFYQSSPYSASNIVSNLIPKEGTPLNKYNAQFICSLLRKESEKYSWGGFKFSVGRVRETMLLLPTTPSGTPDWEYMESYMRGMEEKARKRLKELG